jgi:hypothetical protein
MRERLALGAAHQQRSSLRRQQELAHPGDVIGMRNGNDAQAGTAERVDQLGERVRDAAHAHPVTQFDQRRECG